MEIRTCPAQEGSPVCSVKLIHEHLILRDIVAKKLNGILGLHVLHTISIVIMDLLLLLPSLSSKQASGRRSVHVKANPFLLTCRRRKAKSMNHRYEDHEKREKVARHHKFDRELFLLRL